MSPQGVRVTLDLIAILLGIGAVMLARKSAMGGMFGKAMAMILLGIFILTVNNALDTILFSPALKYLGHISDFFQPAIIERCISILGFGCMTYGFFVIVYTHKFK